MYECPNCAGELRYDIPSGKLACDHCGSKMFVNTVSKESDATERNDYDVTIFTCPQCAGEILSLPDTAATFCSFCGASTILDSRLSNMRKPRHIIPFTKSKQNCITEFMKVTRKAPFAPDDLKDEHFVESFRGIYMPYWTYDVSQNGPVSLTATHSRRSGDYQIVKTYMIHGELEGSYHGFSHDASTAFADSISEELAPFDIKKAENFLPTYLCGFYADTADVDASVYEDYAADLAAEHTFEKITRTKELKKYQFDRPANKRISTHTMIENAQMDLFPVWFLSYKKGNRIAYATVNGQTGKVVCDLPIDEKKYALVTGGVALALFTVFNLLFTFRPSVTLGITLFLGLLTMLLFGLECYELSKKGEKVNQLSGYLSCGFSCLVAAATLIFRPVSDFYYYGACIVCLATITTALLTIIRYYNLLSTRPIPHFETHKGGDDNA